MSEKKEQIDSRDSGALWSIRMRASKKRFKVQSPKSKKTKPDEIHISGAEGLYQSSEIRKMVLDYAMRAMNHPRGRPDKIVITVEQLEERPVPVPALPFSTVRCNSPSEALRIITNLLQDAGASEKAIRNGIRAVYGRTVMQGASLVVAISGIRVEPERKRGVRVSRLGIRKSAERYLTGKLSEEGINTETVKEALVLASKVSSCRGIVAELCISDDPDYTTGYVASRELGYVRIPHIKQRGSGRGGRVFFVKDRTDVRGIIEYLEKTPVVITKNDEHSPAKFVNYPD